MAKGTSVIPHKKALVLVTSNPESITASVSELEEVGYEVNIVKEASRAMNLEAIKPKHWKPSIFIVDVVLPQMSGYELTRRILDRYSDEKVPVILMSQHRSPEDVLEAYQSGALALLSKPVTWTDVSAALEKFKQKSSKRLH